MQLRRLRAHLLALVAPIHSSGRTMPSTSEESASPASAPRNLTAMLRFPRLRTHAAISPVIPARDFIRSALRDAVRAGRETRPWGLFDTLETSSAHQVKRLEIESGQRISYQ